MNNSILNSINYEIDQELKKLSEKYENLKSKLRNSKIGFFDKCL